MLLYFILSCFVCYIGGKTPDVKKMTYSEIMQHQELRREEVNFLRSMCV